MPLFCEGTGCVDASEVHFASIFRAEMSLVHGYSCLVVYVYLGPIDREEERELVLEHKQDQHQHSFSAINLRREIWELVILVGGTCSRI